MKKLRKIISKLIFKYEHDWSNDFYLYFYDKNGNEIGNNINYISVGINDYNITKGQNPNNNTPFVGYHSDKNYIHLGWVVGHKGSSGVASWFTNKLTKEKEGAGIGIRSDYDQKTSTGMPVNMNFAVDNQITFSINGRMYYTNFVWGMVGPDKWKVFEHTLKDVTTDIFKDTVMDELEIPKQIAETVSILDVTKDTKETWKDSENNYYFGVYSNYSPVRKVNWGSKENNDDSSIISPLVDYYTNYVSDYYIMVKSKNIRCSDSSDGNGLNTVNVYLINFSI